MIKCPRYCSSDSPPQGFTLVELLVAMGLFIFLGIMLVNIVQSTLKIWRTVQGTRAGAQRASAIMAMIAADLAAIFPQGPLLCDTDAAGRPRLRFVRTTGNESQHPLLRYAGVSPLDQGYREYYTGQHDQDKKLRATGGLMEVIYTLGSGPYGDCLWRGLRAPVGGAGSFFIDANVAQQDALAQQCLLLSRGVLHLCWAFWSPHTTTWDCTCAPVKGSRLAASGPSLLWDSSGQRLPAFFLYHRAQISPQQQLIPRLVRITLALAPGNQHSTTQLCQPLTQDGRRLYVRDIARIPARTGFVKIDAEWLQYEHKSASGLRGLRRGCWGTQAARHARGARVHTAVVYQATFSVPAFRESTAALFSIRR